MQEEINLSELKDSWNSRLEMFQLKFNHYASFNQDWEEEVDLNVDDLINPPKEEKIETAVNKIINECLEDPKVIWNENAKKEYLKMIESKMDYVNQVKENIDSVRPELLNTSTLLADKEIVKAEDLDKAIAKLSLHSYRDIDHKAKLKPVEKNYITNPISIIKEERGLKMPLVREKKNDLVINVTIYHNFTGKKAQEFVVLGSQKLTTLRDKIYCVSDYIEENPDTSSYFFINQKFYNDLRTPGLQDLSKEIIETQEKKLKRKNLDPEQQSQETIQQFEAFNMQDCNFEDLEIVIGKPYLYRHQNSCDHLMIFNDVRMRDSSDLPVDDLYPLNIFQNRIKRKRCDGCFLYFAKIMCFNDKMQPQDPSYFCEKCYRNLHFDEEEQLKVKNFQVYPYIHE